MEPATDNTRRSVLTSVVMVLLAGTPAVAQSPGVLCRVADHSMTLDLYLPLAPDGSGAIGDKGFIGQLEIHHQKVQRDRRRHALDGRRPAQFWNHGDELRLMLVLGAGDDRVRLIIEARRRPGGADVHAGNFRLEHGQDLKLTGRLECSVG